MAMRTTITNKLKALETKLDVYNNMYVSRSAILHNFDIYKSHSPGGHVIPVLKSNAYGHGLEIVTIFLKDREMPYIAVDGYFEAIKIHSISSQPVLVMGAIKPSNYSKIKFKNCAFVVHDKVTLKAIGETNKPIKVHLEIETGMGRHGITFSELNPFLKLIKKYKKIKIDGVMTHLADADNPKSVDHVKLQQERFDKAVEDIRSAGFNPKYIHIGQSAGSVKVHSKYANTIRPGIGLYGISPLEKSDKYSNELSELRPAMTLKSTIAKVLSANTGDTISYGCTFVVKRKSQIGVLPLGYYEGIPRALSNRGVVKYKSEYLPIVGRVCMNHTMINLTDSDGNFGDEVTVISSNKSDRNSLQQICDRNDLFNYSFLVGLNQNIRRTATD